MTLLSVDPGLSACGCALWVDGVLQRAELVSAPLKLKNEPTGWRNMTAAVIAWVEDVGIGPLRVVVERMPAYRSDFPSRTLILHGLTAIGAMLLRWAHEGGEAYFPWEWEGTLNRKGAHDPIVARIQKRLSASELKAVKLPSAKSLQHNVWDSVGLGLHDLGRGWMCRS